MIYIITPVFNRKEFTRNYLLALDKQTDDNFETIIVDDGSTDGTFEMIKEEFPDVILLREDGDLWWAEATNVGVRYALEHDASYIMTLNDDTIPQEDYMESMIKHSQLEPKACLGALAIDNASGKVVYGGGTHSWKNGKTVQLLDTLDENDYKGLHEVNFFPGRGLLIPREVFDNIGLYDSKNFPQTVADYDFTYRIINAGYKIYCNYDAKIKIFPDESAVNKIRNNKSLKNYYNHLFSLRGGGNLIFFTKVTLKNCPKKYLAQYLFIGISRRLFGYLRDWIFSK